MMGEMIGGLIQMNSHMELPGIAIILLVMGVCIALVCGIASMYNFVDGDKRFAVFIMVFAVMGVIAAIVGLKLPKDRSSMPVLTVRCRLNKWQGGMTLSR